MIGKIIEFILVFCYLFCFSLKEGHGIDSSMVVSAILILYGVVHPRYAKISFSLLVSRYSKNILKLYLLINVWAALVISLNGTFDYTYLMTFFHMYFLIVVGFLLYSFFLYRGTADRIVPMIVCGFILQTTIEWCSFLIPPFKEIVNITKSEDTIVKGQSYAGVRANGLSGSDFFGLSAAFAVFYMIYLSKKNTLVETNRAVKLLIFIYILSGTFFAGRTGYMGLIVVVLFIFFNKRLVINKKPYTAQEKIVFFLMFAFVFMFINFVISLYYTNEDIHNLLFFTFQNLFLLAEEGTMKTSSMESLGNMYFVVEPITFLVGDGVYTTKEGGYYMSTDVGYMRVLLYMGVIGLFLLLSMQSKIINFRKGDEPILKKYLFLLLLILNFKGEVLCWNQIVLDTVLLFCLQDNFSNYNNLCKYKK